MWKTSLTYICVLGWLYDMFVFIVQLMCCCYVCCYAWELWFECPFINIHIYTLYINICKKHYWNISPTFSGKTWTWGSKMWETSRLLTQISKLTGYFNACKGALRWRQVKSLQQQQHLWKKTPHNLFSLPDWVAN